MTNDEKYIKRCFLLAKEGSGMVSPNPMVGAVVVCDDKIIGEGYHKQYGSFHAEVNAINSVKDKKLLKDSTLYVSLEPCSHYGKTPPCSDFIIENKIKRVVISCKDYNEKVNGRGIKKLEDASIEVLCGVLEEEGLGLNKVFFTFQRKKRPYITLKWAQTIDGFMDIERKGDKKEDYWISNDALRVWVHKQRAESDAILVGRKTIENDNPQLNLRYYYGKNPLRIVIDKDLKIHQDKNIYNRRQDTIIFNSIKDFNEGSLSLKKIDFSSSKKVIDEILSHLYKNNITSLIVEGGYFTLKQFIDNNLWDEANIIIGNKYFFSGKKSLYEDIDKRLLKERIGVDDNFIEIYKNV
jgi:diaminohydroxyphosphoribosylaminopyrimidine deaminase/5-amino-6-(5-phosphoribosylamino)uracil reductase